jgi:hypothetical protein
MHIVQQPNDTRMHSRINELLHIRVKYANFEATNDILLVSPEKPSCAVAFACHVVVIMTATVTLAKPTCRLATSYPKLRSWVESLSP